MCMEVWEYIINFIEVLLFYIFIHTKLPLKKHLEYSKYKQIIYLIVRYGIVCVLNYFQINGIVTMVIALCIELFYVMLFYQGTFILCIFWGSMFSVIGLLSEYITISIPKIFLGIGASEALYGGQLRIPLTMLYVALIAIFVFLSQYISDKALFFTIKEKIFYFIISCSGIFTGHYIILVTFEIEKKFHDSQFTFKLISINLFFIILLLSLLLYIFLLGRSKAINIQLMEKEKIHELEELEYKNLISATENLREMKHDINIHLSVIQSMVTDCSREELLNYILEYNQILDKTHKFISTGNVAIDCILSSKIDAANKMNLELEFSVIVPEEFPLDAIATSSLLGNMWNNALDACKKLFESDSEKIPYIRFFIKPFQDMVIIHMENNFYGNILKNSKGEYLSEKNNLGHGIGLKRIADIVENAQGILQISSNDNIFYVHILLPCKEEAHEDSNS